MYSLSLHGALPISVLSSVSVAKLATPFTAASVVVPPSVLPPGLLPSTTLTFPVKPGTGFPAGSSAVTWTAGLIVTPAAVVEGCTVKASCVAVPGVMSNAVLKTGANALALAVSVRSEERRVGKESRNVGTPDDADNDGVRLGVAPPGIELS